MDLTSIQSLHKARVLVLGDVMLDRYWSGATSRISPEAPVPVVCVGDQQSRPGGAANVAVNINALGAQSTLFGITGDDEASAILGKKLAQLDIPYSFEKVSDQPTVTKLRVLSRHQQLIRLDFEQGFEHIDITPLIARFENALADHDVVILSDYAKGVLADPQPFIQAAIAHNVPVLVDPKRRDFTCYQGANVLTPNQKEFEIVVGPCRDIKTMVAKAQSLIDTLDLQALLITRGDQGMSLISADGHVAHFPANAHEVYDVTGAGDTVIATLATGLATGLTLEASVFLANTAAGIVVGKLGTAAVGCDELGAALETDYMQVQGVVSETQLLKLCKSAQTKHARVVMTNGCFDILHPGHVAYLEEAKRLGDYLIVAVNTDDSVRQLKGNGRPINSLDKRMAVLAGLRAVDWVVPFCEDTPERLICAVLPDVLVKGGDYTIDGIAGAQAVLENGGDVKVLPFVSGCSTSIIINKITEIDDATTISEVAT